MIMKTIVALVDLSDLSFKVLTQAHALARAFDSQVIILHVVGPERVVVDVALVSPTLMLDPSSELLEQDYAQLLEMRDSLLKSGVNASIRQLERGSVETVLAETRKLDADLIILGSHYHSTLYKLLVGSVTDDVLKRAHCPVLVVPADERAKE